MPLGTSQVTTTTGACFLPQLWGPQVVLATEDNLVFAPLTWDWSEGGEKKGDRKNVPSVTNFTATAKAANTQVALNAPSETSTILLMNRHDESSFLLEDLVDIQSSFPLMKYYTHKSGFAVAEQRDTRINTLVSGFSQIVGAQGIDIGDAQVLDAIEFLDLANAPKEDRHGVVFPTQKTALFRVEKFYRADMRGENKSLLRTGEFGEIYGIPFFVSNNVGVSGSTRLNTIFHKEAIATISQAGPRTQGDYMLEYLGHLVVVDQVYGEIEARDGFGVWVQS